MKNLIITSFILLILFSSCTKEYSEINIKSVCIGKLTRTEYNDSIWSIELFNHTDTIIDTSTVDFTVPFSTYIIKWYPLTEEVPILEKTYNYKVEMIGHKIPEELTDNPSGLYSVTENPQVLYYLGFTRCNCDILEKGNRKEEVCKCENGAHFASVNDNDSYIEAFAPWEPDVDNFYYFSLDYTDTKEINDFIVTLQSTVDGLINE